MKMQVLLCQPEAYLQCAWRSAAQSKVVRTLSPIVGQSLPGSFLEAVLVWKLQAAAVLHLPMRQGCCLLVRPGVSRRFLILHGEMLSYVDAPDRLLLARESSCSLFKMPFQAGRVPERTL